MTARMYVKSFFILPNVRVCRTGQLTYEFKTMASRCRLEWLLEIT
jgi:hypothetical protein